MADLGSSEGREADCVRMLKAANLGLETGFSCIGINDVRDQFTLCRVLEGDIAYHDFEKILTIFVSAVRYWKKWLNLPTEEVASATTHNAYVKQKHMGLKYKGSFVGYLRRLMHGRSIARFAPLFLGSFRQL